jgi:hypothetical protein
LTASPWAGKSWPPFLGCRRVDFHRHYAVWPTINSDVYIQTLQNLAEAFQESLTSQKCCWNPPATWQHSHTSLKTQEAITELGRTLLPSAPYSPHLAPSGFHLLGALQGAICGKRFGSDDKVIGEVKKWLQVQKSNWYKKERDGLFSCWQRLLKWWRMCRKTSHLVIPCVCLFKELHNKLLSLRMCCCKTFLAIFVCWN